MATGYNFQAFPPGMQASTVVASGDPLGGDGGIVSRIKYFVVIASTGTVNFEHSYDNVTYFPLAVLDCSSTAQTYVTSCTASGVFLADAAASPFVRVRVSANGSGITVTANKVLG